MIQNATYFLELGGMSALNSLNVTTASLCLLVPGVLLSWYLMALLGRRTILLWGASLITVLWLGIGIACCYSTTTAFWSVLTTLMSLFLSLASAFELMIL
jgi:hypothetical protein